MLLCMILLCGFEICRKNKVKKKKKKLMNNRCLHSSWIKIDADAISLIGIFYRKYFRTLHAVTHSDSNGDHHP